MAEFVEKMNEVEQNFNQLDMKNNATAMYQTVHAAVRQASKRLFWNVNVKSMKNDSIVQLKKEM